MSAASCRAQLPFYTDDADTTDKGKFHFEFFNEHDLLQKEVYPGKRQNIANFALNYGLNKRLELDIDAPLVQIYNARSSRLGNPLGIGDTQFGIKYRFNDERESSRLPALAVVFYVQAPTGSSQLKLGSGVWDYWLYGIAQKSLTKKIKARVNGGILFAGNNSTGLIGILTTRGKVFTANASLTRDVSSRLTVGAEIFGAVTNNFLLSKGQLEAQIGGRYALNKNTSVTFGIIGGHFPAAPRAGASIGFTYDFK